MPYEVRVRIETVDGVSRWVTTEGNFDSEREAGQFAEAFSSWIPAKDTEVREV